MPFRLVVPSEVLEKTVATDSEIAQNKEAFRDQLLNDRRGRFFSAYMVKAKQKMRIETNHESLQRAIG